MIIEATRDGFDVTDKDNFKEFHVAIRDLNHEEFISAVEASPDVSAHEEPRHVWVSTGLLHRALDTAARPERAAGLESMLGYARSRGWLSEDGDRVTAHVVVPE
jgi:hypothetical protein